LSKDIDDKKYLEMILNEYSTIISQYNLKQKIEFDSSDSSSEEVEDLENDDNN
jgi:hypothetical protein